MVILGTSVFLFQKTLVKRIAYCVRKNGMVHFSRKNCLTNLCYFYFFEHGVSLISRRMLLKLRRKTKVFLRNFKNSLCMLRKIRVQKKICQPLFTSEKGFSEPCRKNITQYAIRNSDN
ncbi:MAG: hypothetical protein DRI32_02725 [Chloroflexi bacterium]|nr:MAG: hypothetical protein DRI32_02725 [Chloroflexota bacterium]